MSGELRIELDGNEYLIEQTKDGLRIGVVIINTIRAQHAYIRWLPTDGKRAKQVLAAANAA